MAYTIKLQWYNSGAWEDVTTTTGDIDTGQVAGDGKIGYWTTPKIDAPNLLTVDVRLVAVEE